MLTTELTRRLGIEHPIIQAGMGSECTAPLAVAVSNAGGLGTIGTIGLMPDQVREQIRLCKEGTTRPFAANFVSFPWAKFAMDLVDIVIEERVPVVTISFGDIVPVIEKVKSAGLKTVAQVQDLEGARAAIGARPDIIVVQGNEAGGHTGRRGTLNFVAQVLDMAGDIPVVAAGGIATGRGLAAVIAMGGAGAVVGTRFKASDEFAGARGLKDAIAASDGSNTFYGHIVDIPYALEWPSGVTGRVIANEFTQEWAGREPELKAKVEALPRHQFLGELASKPDTVINWAGESSGLISSVRPAADIVRDIAEEAEQLLRKVSTVLSSVAKA